MAAVELESIRTHDEVPGIEAVDGLENVSCAICGGTDGKILFESYDKLWGHPGTFPAVRCDDCGLVYLNPRPSHGMKQQLYDDYGYKPGQVAQPLEHYMPVVETLSNMKADGGRVLDVGTGNAPFLPEMKSRGWEVQGTEVDDSFADFYQEYGIDVHVGELEDAGYEAQAFDAVTMMGVIEHLPDPRRALLEINRTLKDDGIFGLWCFNRGLEARLLGKHWLGFDAPRHLYSFSPEAMGRLLEDTGFEPFASYHRPHTHMAITTAWTLKRLKNGLTGKQGSIFTVRVPRSLRLLYAPLGKMLAASKTTSDVYLFCRKQAG